MTHRTKGLAHQDKMTTTPHPQEVVSKTKFDEYVKQLKEFDLDNMGIMVDELEDDCEGGVCPVR